MAFMDSPGFDRAAREAYRVIRAGGTLYFERRTPLFLDTRIAVDRRQNRRD